MGDIWHIMVAVHDWLNSGPLWLYFTLTALFWYWLGYRRGAQKGNQS